MSDIHSPGVGHNQPPVGLAEIGENHILACPRINVGKALERGYLRHKLKWLRQLEGNNLIAACCRNPAENADIEAWYSCPDDEQKGVPDIYKFHCRECERAHVYFCVGGNHPLAKKYSPQIRPDLYDFRPKWEIR